MNKLATLLAAASLTLAPGHAQTPAGTPNFAALSVAGVMLDPRLPQYGTCTWDATHDVAPCIQAALTYAGTLAGGGIVSVPAGTYLVGSTLSIPSNTTLRGQGRGMSWLKEADGANLKPMITNANAAGALSTILDRNITIRDLSIDGNGATQELGQTDRCIFTMGVEAISIINVDVNNCRTDAVFLNGNAAPFPNPAHAIFVDELHVVGTYGTGVGWGAGLQISNRYRNALVSNVFIENTTNSGVIIDASEGNWSNIHVKGAGFGTTGTAPFCSPTGTQTVDNPGDGGAGQSAWNPCQPGIRFNNVTNVTATNLVVYGSRYYGVMIVGTRHSTISNVVSVNNSLGTPGTWDDMHLDLEAGAGYGENHGLTIVGANLGANGQVGASQAGSSPATARYGLFIADGLAGSTGDATIVSGGTGYVASNLLTCAGGTSQYPCKFQVIAAPSGGTITQLDFSGLRGKYTALPPNPVSLSGGAGTGATANIAWSTAYITGVTIGQTLTAPVRMPAFSQGWIVQTNAWGAQTGGNPTWHPGYVVNSWYSPVGYNSTAPTPVANGANIVSCSFGMVPQSVTASTLGGRITTLAAGGNVQFAVYANGAWGRPSTLVAATGNITTAATGAVNAAASAPLPAGNYWFCQNADNATVALSAQNNSVGGVASPFIGSVTQGSAGSGPAAIVLGISTAQTFGTWPNFTSGTAWAEVTTAYAPFLTFKISSVP